MLVQNENGQNKIDLETLKIFRWLEFSTIYYTKNGLLKVFKYEPNPDLELILKNLIKLNLRHFYQIFDLFYNEQSKFCGYLMQKQRNYPLNILEYPSNYTIENYKEMFEELIKLAKEHILVRDLSCENSIFNPYDITIIDVDDYMFCDYEPVADNLFGLNCLFKEYFLKAIFLHYPYLISRISEVNKIINEIFSKEKEPGDVQRKLSRYKYPIEYIEERLN